MMTEADENQADGRRTEKDIAAELRLRPDPPRVMRLSRRAIAILTGIGGLGLAAILISALQDNRDVDGAQELFSTDRVQQAEGLGNLPRSYGDIPQLGPPLPGELGRAVLGAQDRGIAVVPPAATGPMQSPVDPAEQMRLQEAEAARLSALFAEANTVQGAGPGPAQSAPAGPGPLFSGVTLAPGSPLDQGTALGEAGPDGVENPARLMIPSSPYVLQAGTVIPAALVTGIRSDLPGQVTAQVTAPVYDSPSGRYLLIPQGARLVGTYESEITSGQRRLMLAWTRLILPDGRSITLGSAPGADQAGYSGLEDQVDNHWSRVFLAAGLATILNIGLETGGSDDEVAEAIREGAQETIGRTGEEIVRQQLAQPPTLTIRPGFSVHVVVTRDLVLEPLGVVQ